MECEEYISRRVKLGYVADSPTSIQLVDSFGNQIFDLLPVIQAGETDTSLSLLTDLERIRYYPEEFTRTDGASGCYYDICISDIAALISLNQLRNVEHTNPATGETIMYNAETGLYEMYDLAGNLAGIGSRIDAVNSRVDALATTVNNLANNLAAQTARINNLFELVSSLTNSLDALRDRVAAIENAIYNWSSDKSTKIPRGNINVTSGGYTSGNGIYTRAANTNNDLNFS